MGFPLVPHLDLYEVAFLGRCASGLDPRFSAFYTHPSVCSVVSHFIHDRVPDVSTERIAHASAIR